MAALIYEIPITVTGPSWTQETALDGRKYLLTFRWNAREACWYLSLSDINNVSILAGLKLIDGASLLRHGVGVDRPPGEILCLGDPTYDNLGTDVRVVYMDASEIS